MLTFKRTPPVNKTCTIVITVHSSTRIHTQTFPHSSNSYRHFGVVTYNTQLTTMRTVCLMSMAHVMHFYYNIYEHSRGIHTCMCKAWHGTLSCGTSLAKKNCLNVICNLFTQHDYCRYSLVIRFLDHTMILVK